MLVTLCLPKKVAGVQFGGGGVGLVYEFKGYGVGDNNHDLEGYRFGLLGGYKQFFTPKFGLRYYAAFDMGQYSSNPSFKAIVDEYSFVFNVEMLYNFITSETSDFGVFAGVGLGYVIYSYDMKENALISNKEQKRQIVDISRDFDIRFVAGLRVNLAKRHGIELYSRFALMKQKEIYIITPIKSFSGGWDYITTTLTNKALTSFGIGYVFSF